MASTSNYEVSEPTITPSGPHILVTVNINGHKITISKRNLDHFDAQDPYFFDSDYTIAGSTGFLLWEANWLLLRLLRTAPLPVPLALAGGDTGACPLGTIATTIQPLGRLLAGRRVLDLGSGTGLAGLAAAAWGAHVLLTDLASVCEGTLRANVQRNALQATSSSGAETPQATETAGGSNAVVARATAAAEAEAGAPDGSAVAEEERQREQGRCGGEPVPGQPWSGAVRVGQGSAAVMALDWMEPLEPQVRAAGNDPRDADFILAVDTIWLLDIFYAFIDVVLAVLSRGSAPAAAATADQQVQQAQQQKTQQRACFLAFVERASADSKLFVRKEAVEAELRCRGCQVEVLVAEDVDVDGVARPGRVLRVTLADG